MVLLGFAMVLLGVAMIFLRFPKPMFIKNTFLWFLGGLWAVREMPRRLGVEDHEQILDGLHLGQE